MLKNLFYSVAKTKIIKMLKSLIILTKKNYDQNWFQNVAMLTRIYFQIIKVTVSHLVTSQQNINLQTNFKWLDRIMGTVWKKKVVIFSNFCIVGTRFLIPVLWRPPVFLTPPPSFSTSRSPLPFPFLFLWSHHICVVLFNYMDLKLSRLGALVSAAPCCVFNTTRPQIYWGFNTDTMVFPSTLIWYLTNRQQAHTGTNRLNE